MAQKFRVLRFLGLVSSSGGTVTQLNNGAATVGWLISTICFHNAQASTITLDVYVTQSGGTSTYLYKAHSIAAGAQLLIEKEITLKHDSPADALFVRCVNASNHSLDCVITGLERDQ